MYKSGFISIVGRPNAGKSTLINRMVGEKVSIVSWRPQTTRDKIIGIINGDDYQACFIDTPGIHNAKNKLSEYMLKSIYNSLVDIDAILYIIDGTKPISEIDENFLEEYSMKVPLIVAVNKRDLADTAITARILDQLNSYKGILSVYSISARYGENVDKLLAELIEQLPEGEMLYPEDLYTDKHLRFMVSEIIREKALMYLNQEIPYGIGVDIHKFSARPNSEITDIFVDLLTERKQHKSIIIGKNGSMLKKIGETARIDIERLIGTKVYLKLFVKVEEEWRNKVNILEELGYDKNNL